MPPRCATVDRTVAHTYDRPQRFPSDRRERAKAMVEAGLFGGAGRGQGRKRKAISASAEVADLAAREAGAIKKVYRDGLRSQNERTRLMAAKELLAEERRELDRRDASDEFEAELERMSDEEFKEYVYQAIIDPVHHWAGKLPPPEVGEFLAKFDLLKPDGCVVDVDVIDDLEQEVAAINGAGHH
jgi:hypothetical protein